jgi:hypothetical protein
MPITSMKKIHSRQKKEALPRKTINKLTTEINNLIDQYNKLDDSNEQIKILKKIHSKIKTIDNKYPASWIEKSPHYRKNHDLLFRELKKQYKSLGIPLVSTDNSFPLSECIANMSPKKVNKLASTLETCQQPGMLREPLDNIYDKNDKHQEAKTFRAILNTHEISFLGGSHSKNFKVTNTLDNSTYVLKIENRFDLPKGAEIHLRKQLKHIFAPIYSERLATYLDGASGKKKTRTLLVTKYCSEKCLYTHGKRTRQNLRLLAPNVNRIFTQMATIMLSIEKADCMFPDGKLMNWLIENGQLTISDTKSFVFIEHSGLYSKQSAKKKHYSLAYTESFKPPEFCTSEEIKANSAHAFILGKNIYTYITGILLKDADANTFEFKKPFFKQSPLGRQYELLIKRLVKPDPKDRISVEDALQHLTLLTHLSELLSLKFNSDTDTKMETFIQEKIKQFDNASSIQRNEILNDLHSVVDTLKTDKVLAELKIIIQHFKAPHGLFSRGMKAKAYRIEQAIGNVPIEERGKLLESESGKEVMKALASHRHFGKRGVTFFTKTDTIDSKKAARSFKEFNNKFKN